MKNIILILIASITMIYVFSCKKDDSVIEKSSPTIAKSDLYHSVTEAEYNNATAFTKRLIDQVDAAVNSLDIMSKSTNSVPYEAIINISKSQKNKFSNFVTISPADNSSDIISESIARVAAPDGKCHVCGMGSAYSCIIEVEEYMDKNHKDEIDIHVKRSSDGCVDITYK